MCAFTQRAREAGMAQSDFGRALAGAERRMERAAVELARTRRLLEREDMAGAFGSAFAFSAEVEKLALLARVLPAYTGHPKAAELTEQMLLDTVPIEMGYARRGWFLLKIPALLPKKGTGSPIYIQQYLYPALRRYFDGKPPARYRSCVLAYRHVYQRGRPERAYRDHDNIEVNMVTDIITLYLLPDDAPRRCAHYYCSAAGEVDCTEVYVVPASRFPEWLAAEQADDLKEDTLYETSEIWAEKIRDFRPVSGPKAHVLPKRRKIPEKTGVSKRDRETICGKERNSHALNPDDPGQSEMITLRPGSHVWRLLLLLAICGEYPSAPFTCWVVSGRWRSWSEGWRWCSTSAPPPGQTSAPAKCSPPAGGGTGGRSGCIRAPCRSCRPCTRQPSAGILPPPAVTASPGVQAMWSEIIGSRNRWQSVWGPE